jgi:hypothetical protein
LAHYIFNSVPEEATRFLAAGVWGVGPDEPHRDALAAGDLVLVYLGAPERVFIGRAELASAVREWTSGASTSGVSLAQVEQWDAPVPMDVVLSRLDSSAKAKADFEFGVVRIIQHEYETVLAAAEKSV